MQVIKKVVPLQPQMRDKSDAILLKIQKAKIAQLVERNLAKVEVAGSNPVFRSFFMSIIKARMVESVDTLDLKSSGQQCLCGFKSRSEYDLSIQPFEFQKVVFFYRLI